MFPWGGTLLYRKLPAVNTTTQEGRRIRRSVVVTADVQTISLSARRQRQLCIDKHTTTHQASGSDTEAGAFSHPDGDLSVTPPVNTNTGCFHCERSAMHESHKVQWGRGFTARDNCLSGCMRRDLDQQEAQPVISLDFTNLPPIRQHHVTITVTAILFKTGGLF